MEIKITKKTLIREGMFNLKYYLIQGRIINDEKTKYKRFKFIINFDDNDLFDYYEKSTITKKDIADFMDGLIFTFTDAVKSYDNVKYFYELCNETINDYNKKIN